MIVRGNLIAILEREIQAGEFMSSGLPGVQNLSEIAEKILLFLGAAHESGNIDCRVDEVGRGLGLEAEAIAEALDELETAGCLDKSDLSRAICLSGRGLRFVKERREVMKAAPAASRRVPAVERTDDVSRRVREFLGVLQDRSSDWESVVTSSALSPEEQQHLVALGKEFFVHPAVWELLRRLMIGAR